MASMMTQRGRLDSSLSYISSAAHCFDIAEFDVKRPQPEPQHLQPQPQLPPIASSGEDPS